MKQAADTAKAAEVKAKISKLAALEDKARQDEKAYERTSIRPDLAKAIPTNTQRLSKATTQRARVDDRELKIGFGDESSVAATSDHEDNSLNFR